MHGWEGRFNERTRLASSLMICFIENISFNYIVLSLDRVVSTARARSEGRQTLLPHSPEHNSNLHVTFLLQYL